MDQREAEAEAEGEEERIGDKADVLGEPQLGLGYVQFQHRPLGGA